MVPKSDKTSVHNLQISPSKTRNKAQASGVLIASLSAKSREKIIDISKIYEKDPIPERKKRRYIQLTKDARSMLKIQE